MKKKIETFRYTGIDAGDCLIKSTYCSNTPSIN